MPCSGRDGSALYSFLCSNLLMMASSHDVEQGEQVMVTLSESSQASRSPKDNVSFPSFSSGFPPTRPNSSGRQLYSPQEYPQIDPSSTIGQFSFAPATQTTVVTTTTTTTTKFPPFVMRAPRRMQDLDPKLYPLASAPTPASLRNICFELGGKPTVFREAEDATSALGKASQTTFLCHSFQRPLLTSAI